MSIDFKKVLYVRDNLKKALWGWRDPKDGLWRSIPDKIDTEPSFTCTAMSIHALQEAGELGQAQMVADSILPIMFPGNEYHPLPSEGNHTKTHIMNNSWTVFSLLECYPAKVKEIWPAVEWIMGAQDKTTGWWNLLHVCTGDKTPSPIFCAYALAAIIQYFDQANRMHQLDDTQRRLIMECLDLGIDGLLNIRTNYDKENKFLIWPQKIGNNDASFGVSTMCAHVLSKAGRVLDKPHWSAALVPKTFEEFGHGLEVTGADVKITVNGHPVVIWDAINNEGRINYNYSVFAPINLVTVIRYIGTNNSETVNQFYTLIDYFTNWILDNAKNDGNGGVMGSNNIRNPTTWSTAMAIITLSRILNNKELIKRVEATLEPSKNPNPTASIDTIKKSTKSDEIEPPKPLSIITRIANKLSDYKRFNVLIGLFTIGGFFISIFMSMFFQHDITLFISLMIIIFAFIAVLGVVCLILRTAAKG